MLSESSEACGALRVGGLAAARPPTWHMKLGMTRWKVEPLKCRGLPDLPTPFSPARPAGRSGGWVSACWRGARDRVRQWQWRAAPVQALSGVGPLTRAQGPEVLGRLGGDVRAQLRAMGGRSKRSERPGCGDTAWRRPFWRAGPPPARLTSISMRPSGWLPATMSKNTTCSSGYGSHAARIARAPGPRWPRGGLGRRDLLSRGPARAVLPQSPTAEASLTGFDMMMGRRERRSSEVGGEPTSMRRQRGPDGSQRGFGCSARWLLQGLLPRGSGHPRLYGPES